MDKGKNYPPYLDYPKQYKSITNADRIRAMSDEELVLFVVTFSGRFLYCAVDVKYKSCPIYKEGYYCRPQDIMGWIKQQAE